MLRLFSKWKTALLLISFLVKLNFINFPVL